MFFFFNVPATTEIYTLSLHDASSDLVRDLSDDMEEQYELVGPGEENYDGDIMKILTSSPIGQGLMGKKVGEQAEVDIPSGKLKLEIVAIE